MIHLLLELEEFFSGKKKEKRQLREKILKEYGKKVPDTYDLEKLKELQSLLDGEKKFLEEYKNTEFTFFGYIRSEDELPKFFYEKKSPDLAHITAVAPFTPKTFKHCMKNLEDSEKLSLVDNDFFAEAFWKIAYHSKYQEENWSDAFREIRSELKKDCEKIERKFGAKITAKDLTRVDWDRFCGEIKPYIGPSYSKKPESVDVKTMPSGCPVVHIKMNSKTTPSYRTIRIDGLDVSQSMNTSKIFTRCGEEIHKIWRGYFGNIIKQYMGDIKDKNSSNSTM